MPKPGAQQYSILAITYTYSGTMLARPVLQDSGEEMSFSKRLKELIFVAKKKGTPANHV
jgi:hypothetical protein